MYKCKYLFTPMVFNLHFVRYKCILRDVGFLKEKSRDIFVPAFKLICFNIGQYFLNIFLR